MRELPELAALKRSAKRMKASGRLCEHGAIPYKGLSFPLLSFHFGSEDQSTPALIFVAGVHGLEKIGTQVVTSFLDSWIHLTTWDSSLQSALEKCRVIFYPLVNPVGMLLNRRSNGNGVDLMRNAPVEAERGAPPFISGHRISPSLPWYRGEGEMEQEALILCNFIKQHCFHGGPSIVLDVHSGFGINDRLWFPYAKSSDYFPDASSMLSIKRLMDRSYPHHTYTMEPQHFSYRTHGDLWDYLHIEHQKVQGAAHFLPLCLEMGSWTWVKKNPRQLLSILGLFNPILPHRVKRVERRHFLLFNFLVKLISSPASWTHGDDRKKLELEHAARRLWYAGGDINT